jgi:signal transduction histidine kinase
MTIRMRLTLWYAGVLFISILLIGPLSYYELVVERRHANRKRAEAAVFASSSARLEAENRAEEEITTEIREIILWYSLPAALLGLAGGLWLTREILAPISILTRIAERINEGNLAEPISGSGNGDELDRLTGVFNAMIGRLSDSFQRIRDFTLNASHELKTPLTVLHGEMESSLNDPDCTPASRERTLGYLDEIQRLTRIVDGLTFLTKADSGLLPMAHEPVPLDELVRDAFADAEVLAQPGGLTVVLASCEALMVIGDRHRLRQLLLNLTDNAVKYNTTGGRISISLRRNHDSADLQIVNTGPGIPPEERERVFDRFYRGTARQSDVEGSGLGLSIARWIASAHRGTISIREGAGHTTVVQVALPLMP